MPKAVADLTKDLTKAQQLLLQEVQKALPQMSAELLEAGLKIAHAAHEGQTRASGEPYLTHVIHVARITLELLPDEKALLAALLHDAEEDHPGMLPEIKKKFGAEVADLVAGLTKMSRTTLAGAERNAEGVLNMLLTMVRDPRVALVKLADRLHNMETIGALPHQKQERIARETLGVYAPLADRLGVHVLKARLQDLCFAVLEPEEHQKLQQGIQQVAESQEKRLKTISGNIATLLKKQGIDAPVKGRVKHLYSLFNKMQRKQLSDPSELFDMVAFRVLVPDVASCYSALGVLHRSLRPLPGRMKDYIAVPKPNGYKSLHTTVAGGPLGTELPVEIQIRTPQMDAEAEHGLAAHWRYKGAQGAGGGASKAIALPSWAQHLAQQLQEEQGENASGAAEKLGKLQEEQLGQRIFVLTPAGDIKDLPAGSTPVDFAFSVHSDLGLRLRGARVDSRSVPLSYALQSGEVCSITTGKAVTAVPGWLGHVKSNRARTALRGHFNAQEGEKIAKHGRDMLTETLKKFGHPPLDGALTSLKNLHGYQTRTRAQREDLLRRVGNGSLAAVAIIKAMDLPTAAPAAPTARKARTAKAAMTKAKEASDQPQVIVAGESGLPVRIPSCCRPRPGVEIVGFVTRGGGVAIHRKDCATVANTAEESRLLEARWSNEPEMEAAWIEIGWGADRLGLLRDMALALAQSGMNITGYRAKRRSPLAFRVVFSVEAHSLECISKAMAALERVPGVRDVRRIRRGAEEI